MGEAVVSGSKDEEKNLNTLPQGFGTEIGETHHHLGVPPPLSIHGCT